MSGYESDSSYGSAASYDSDEDSSVDLSGDEGLPPAEPAAAPLTAEETQEAAAAGARDQFWWEVKWQLALVVISGLVVLAFAAWSVFSVMRHHDKEAARAVAAKASISGSMPPPVPGETDPALSIPYSIPYSTLDMESSLAHTRSFPRLFLPGTGEPALRH